MRPAESIPLASLLFRLVVKPYMRSPRDDIGSLNLPKSAKKYARMTSKDLGDDWSAKVDMYISAAADLTNQSSEKDGFKNKDASGKVKHAFKESAQKLVASLMG